MGGRGVWVGWGALGHRPRQAPGFAIAARALHRGRARGCPRQPLRGGRDHGDRPESGAVAVILPP